MVNWTGDVDDNEDESTETDGESDLAESVIEDVKGEDESEGSDDTEEEEAEDDEAETEPDAEEPEAEPDSDEDAGDVDLEEEVEEEAEELVEEMEEAEEDEADDDDVSDAIAEVADDASEGSDDEDDQPPKEDGETAEVPDTEPEQSVTDGGLIDTQMINEAAPSATAREDAAAMDPRWTFLVWGDEGTGKSHFAHTAPEPICYLDTEGKASNLAGKFEKEVVYFDATDYDQARQSLVESMALLNRVRDQHDVVGTIVVDSMSKLWEFAQQKHVDEHYVTKESPEDVTFKSGLQGGDDWKKIKKYHNARFRDVLAECPYHVVMTAMAEEDYNAVMDGADGKPMKPQGEKNNKYAVENIVRLRSGPSGDTVGDLLKTDRTRLRFRGLEWPTFDDSVDFIDRISEAEQAEGSVDVDDWPVDVVRGSPDTTAESEGDDDD